MSKSIKPKDNVYLDSSGIVHNKTTLKDILTYSTTETKIGTWIDGKPIYRRVFTGRGRNVDIVKINNLGQVLSMRGVIYSIYNQWWNIPNYHSETAYHTSLYYDSNGLHLSTGANFNSNSPYIVILEYTKSTD